MTDFESFTLDNGLRVIVHVDHSTPLVAVNLLYDVGSKDEDPDTTGLAHLFEHLMFSGTKRIPNFDTPLQIAGGENNAFTNTDITNYYITIPRNNLETALWVESDRMNEINLSKKNINIQKSVVIEEFKQRYLNQPYGDSSHLTRYLTYKVHPYRWPTIGLKISHIQEAKEETIRDFYYSHYAPNNAILCLAGNIEVYDAKMLVDKWFGSIERREVKKRNLPVEPEQTEARFMEVKRDVPTPALYKTWHGPIRNSVDFVALDMITDLLAGGESGSMQNILVREKQLFSNANIYVSGEIEAGTISFYGSLQPGVDIQKADEEVTGLINELTNKPISYRDIEKVKNRHEASAIYGNTSILNKAMNLSLYELMGNANLIDKELETYRQLSIDDVVRFTKKYLNPNNCNTLYYNTK